MKSLNCNPSSWEIDKLNNALKVHNLEQDLEKLREECNDLRKELNKSKQKVLLCCEFFMDGRKAGVLTSTSMHE